MTLDEAIEIFEQDAAETILNLSELRSDELANWLKELKAYRSFKENCKRFSYTVHSELFAKHIEDYITNRVGDNTMLDGIINAEKRLNELKTYEEHRANGDITEAVLICHPKVANVLKKVIYENQLKDIPMIITPLAEEDKIYMSTDKDFIENARKMAE